MGPLCASNWNLTALASRDHSTKGNLSITESTINGTYHTCTLCIRLQMKEHCKPVCGCMVCRESALIWQQFHLASPMWWPNSTVSTPLRWIFKMCYKKASRSFRIKCKKNTASLLKNRESHYIKMINNNVNNNCQHSADLPCTFISGTTYRNNRNLNHLQ